MLTQRTGPHTYWAAQSPLDPLQGGMPRIQLNEIRRSIGVRVDASDDLLNLRETSPLRRPPLLAKDEPRRVPHLNRVLRVLLVRLRRDEVLRGGLCSHHG